MANPEHVEVVKQGAEAIAKWRAETPDVTLDLGEADLSRADLSRADLSGADLHGADLHGADLHGARLHGADLGGADLHEAILHEANLSGADLGGAYLDEADLDEANLLGAHLGGAILRQANLRQANLYRANLYGANLYGANLNGANLRRADLGGVHLDGADLGGTHLNGANLLGAHLREADLRRADLREVHGACQAYDLETTQVREGDAQYFETCQRPWPERWLDWERLRVVGRLPLFGISYTALILIPIVFYGLAQYNRNIDLVHAWAQEAVTSPDHPLYRLSPHILEHLHRLPLPSFSFLLFISTILLAAGSTLYTFSCPSRVKEFSRDQWCDQLGHSLLHYWPLAWKHRTIRLVCAACYAFGGLGALWVLGTKLGRTGQFIWQHSTWSWW
jgi:uncharacterized protein YjbI with pentapeptide repeats